LLTFVGVAPIFVRHTPRLGAALLQRYAIQRREGTVFVTRLALRGDVFDDPASVDSAGLPARGEEPLQPLGKPLRRGDEMSGARREQPLAVKNDGQGIADALEARRVIARRDQRGDAGLANSLERGTSLAGKATALGATYAVRHGIWERSIVDPRRTSHAKKCPQHLWIGIETLRQHSIPDPLEALNLRIPAHQVVQRRLDQGKGAHLCRPLRRCKQGSKHAIGVRDDVRTRSKQRNDVSRVTLKVLAPIQGLRARRVAATMDRCKRPPRTQRRERSPSDLRARTPVYQEDLRAVPHARDRDPPHDPSVGDAARRRGLLVHAPCATTRTLLRRSAKEG
jgi:hypothetical protein